MNRRAGLGRGLDALLPAVGDARVMELELSQISPNPHQPRKEFSEEELTDLASSIREVGLLQPVIVRPAGAGGYELIVGERRLRASKLAGLERIPAVVREAGERDALEQALVENLQREDLRPLEEAEAYRQLVDLFELSQEEVARRMGRSRVHVTNTLRLLDLPDGVRAMLEAGVLTAGHGRALLAIKDAITQQRAAQRVVDEGLTVRQVEALARDTPVASKQAASTPKSSRYPDLEDALSDRFGSDVFIQAGRGRGKIVINFGSKADLDRIARMLLNH